MFFEIEKFEHLAVGVALFFKFRLLSKEILWYIVVSGRGIANKLTNITKCN